MTLNQVTEILHLSHKNDVTLKKDKRENLLGGKGSKFSILVPFWNKEWISYTHILLLGTNYRKIGYQNYYGYIGLTC